MQPDYRFRDVIITPFYAVTGSFFAPVSLLGGVSIDRNYFAHGRFGGIASRPVFTTRHARIVRHPCVFGGYWLPDYGHFLLETLQRLYFIAQMPENADIVFPYAEGGILPWQREILKLLNIRGNIVFLEENTLFRDIYIPPPGASLGWHLTDAQLAAFARVKAAPRHGERLFISRAGIAARGCENEAELEHLLERRGWRILRPEKMPVPAQLALLARAQTIFAIAGSALHSLLFFAPTRQRFIIVPRVHNATYNMIARARCSDYHLLNIAPELTAKAAARAECRFRIDLDEMAAILDKSADFKLLAPIAPLLSAPGEPPPNFGRIPDAYLQKRPRAEAGDNLVHMLITAGDDRQKALRILAALIAGDLVAPHMRHACHAALTRLAPGYDDLYALFFNYDGSDAISAVRLKTRILAALKAAMH